MDSQMVAFSLERKALMYKHKLGCEKQRVSMALHFRPLVQMLDSYIFLILQSILQELSDGHSKSHLPQCL